LFGRDSDLSEKGIIGKFCGDGFHNQSATHTEHRTPNTIACTNRWKMMSTGFSAFF
jgi:hypothetical protein